MNSVTREDFDRLARAVNKNASDAQMRLERIEYERDIDSFRKRLLRLEDIVFGIAAERMREGDRLKRLDRTKAWRGKNRLPNLMPFGSARMRGGTR